MNEIFRAQGEETDDQKKSAAGEAREKLMQQAREGWLEFGHRFENTINAYFGTPDMRFTVKPGGWYIDLEKIEVNADPNFFLEKGYSESESMFCTFHEAEHFRDMIRDGIFSADAQTEYSRLFTRIKSRTDVHPQYPKALQTMWNCLEDVMVNKVVMNRWKSGAKAKDVLYPKLFPNTDLRGKPRHRQFMYALLREAMRPDEPMDLDPEVREAINRCQARPGGRGRTLDVLTATDIRGQARLAPRERFALMRTNFEPVFEALYRQDLIDRKAEDRGEPGGDDPFGADPEADGIPDPMDLDEAAEMAKRISDAIRDKKKNEFKDAMGVDEADFAAYQEDYGQVEPHIEKLSATFDEVIQRRKTTRRVLRKPTKEGPMMDMHKAAIAVPMLDLGQEPIVMKDYEIEEKIENRPSEFEFTMVGDGSGSMVGGAKERMQKRLAVLTVEALARFRERIAKVRRQGENINLQVKSEVRIFSDQDHVVKPLSESLTHPERVAMHKALKKLPGGNNNEPATFIAIGQEQFDEARLTKLAKGDLKKVILFFTDGETGVAAVQAEIARLMELAGPKGSKNLVIAGIGFDDGLEAINTYAPNGYYAKSLDEVVEIYETFLKKILDDL